MDNVWSRQTMRRRFLCAAGERKGYTKRTIASLGKVVLEILPAGPVAEVTDENSPSNADSLLLGLHEVSPIAATLPKPVAPTASAPPSPVHISRRCEARNVQAGTRARGDCVLHFFSLGAAELCTRPRRSRAQALTRSLRETLGHIETRPHHLKNVLGI